jgi:hypothetical protein
MVILIGIEGQDTCDIQSENIMDMNGAGLFRKYVPVFIGQC